MKLKLNRHGYYTVHVPGPKGRGCWISTGEVDLAKARRLCIDGALDRIILMARAGAMTASAIQMVTAGRAFSCLDLLNTWDAEMKIGVSDGTRRTYTASARQFFKFVGGVQRNFQSVTRYQLEQFINGPGVKLSTRRHRLHSLISLYDHASNNGMTVGNLARTIVVRHNDLPYVLQVKEPAQPFTHDEYQKITGSLDLPTFWRRAGIISYWTGMRLSDVCAMQVDHISETHVSFYAHKRIRHISLPLANPLIGNPDLLAVLAEIKALAEDPPFCFTEHLDYTVRQPFYAVEFKRYLVKLGISGKSFHGFRHAFASRLAAAGTTLPEIAGLLGHSPRSPLTTRGYVHA